MKIKEGGKMLFVQKKLTLLDICLSVLSGMFVPAAMDPSYAVTHEEQRLINEAFERKRYEYYTSLHNDGNLRAYEDALELQKYDAELKNIGEALQICHFNITNLESLSGTYNFIVDMLNKDPLFLDIANELRKYDVEGYPSSYLLDSAKAAYVAKHGATLVSLGLTTEPKVQDAAQGLASSLFLMEEYMDANKCFAISLKAQSLPNGRPMFSRGQKDKYVECKFIRELGDLLTNENAFYLRYVNYYRNFFSVTHRDYETLTPSLWEIREKKILMTRSSQFFLASSTLSNPIAAVLFAMEPSLVGDLRIKVFEALPDELFIAFISFYQNSQGDEKLYCQDLAKFFEMLKTAFSRGFLGDPFTNKSLINKLESFPSIDCDNDLDVLDLFDNFLRLSEIYLVRTLDRFFTEQTKAGIVDFSSYESKMTIIAFVKDKLWPCLLMQEAVAERFYEQPSWERFQAEERSFYEERFAFMDK